MRPAQQEKIAGKTPRAGVRNRHVEATLRKLRTLLKGSEREQRSTYRALRRALEEDRVGLRSLFDEALE